MEGCEVYRRVNLGEPGQAVERRGNGAIGLHLSVRVSIFRQARRKDRLRAKVATEQSCSPSSERSPVIAWGLFDTFNQLGNKTTERLCLSDIMFQAANAPFRRFIAGFLILKLALLALNK